MRSPVKQIIVLCIMVLGAHAVEAQQIMVSPEGDIQTLARAIELADSNDVIRLQEGRYAERNIIIDKPLTIEGPDEGTAMVDAQGEGFVLIVRADNVTIRNIEVRGSGISFMDDNAGILMDGVEGGLIENVRLTDNFFGIYLSETSGSIIRNNILSASNKRETHSPVV